MGPRSVMACNVEHCRPNHGRLGKVKSAVSGEHLTDESVSGIMNRSETSFVILDRQPCGSLEGKWRACLAASDFPTHYTAPEFFLEPSLRSKRPFAILSLLGEDVTGVLTGFHEGGRVQSGLSVRPQLAFSRTADHSRAMKSLVAGLLQQAKSATPVDIFV